MSAVVVYYATDAGLEVIRANGRCRWPTSAINTMHDAEIGPFMHEVSVNGEDEAAVEAALAEAPVGITLRAVTGRHRIKPREVKP